MLTLRQIEVIYAIMVTGTVGGAARLLNVSSPGINRVMQQAESMLGLKLFGRKGGRYTPTREASGTFSQINGVYDKVGIKARFSSTVCALVTNGLGIAVIDEFTLAVGNWPDLRVLDSEEPTAFQTYIATRTDATLSSYCDSFVTSLRTHMEHLGSELAGR